MSSIYQPVLWSVGCDKQLGNPKMLQRAKSLNKQVVQMILLVVQAEV